jgi:hypothetical protein
MKNNKLSLLFLGFLTIISCSKPTYCECETISRDAIVVTSIGLPRDVNLDKLEDCAEKVKKDINLNIPASQISIDYIQQVSYEMCKHGYYEGKGRDYKKYYNTDK